MTNKQTAVAFIERINAHDVPGLGELMSADHTFIDAHGNQVSGKEKIIAGWRGDFEWFSDYYIEVTDEFQQDENFALFGFAGGALKTKKVRAGVCPRPGKPS